MTAGPEEVDILDCVRDCVLARDAQGRVTVWNTASEQLYGWTRNEAIGRPVDELFTTEYPQPLSDIEEQLRRAGCWEGEVVRTTASGARLDMEICWSVRRNSAAAADIVETARDVTAQRAAFETLQESEQRYRDLFHYMPIPAWKNSSPGLTTLIRDLRAQGVTDLPAYLKEHPGVVDRAMELIAVEEINLAGVRLIGANNADELKGPVRGRRWVSRKAFIQAFDARFRGEENYSAQVKFTTADGHQLEGLLFTALPPPLGESGISFNTFVDATERIRIQDMLQKVQAEFAHAARVSMLGELTASIAHEINQPLAAIATNGEAASRWINRPEPDLDEARELIRRIVTDARRAADIISRVRGMATRGVYTRVPVSLHRTIDEALLFLGHEVQLRGVSVDLERAASLPDVIADRTQLQQVIVNLAVNAMQAMSQSGGAPRRLRVRTALPEPSTACCSIEDSGPGVAPEHLDRMFESFFTTKEGGMGMGLPICRSIIEAHSGRIEVDNGSVFGGARFTFTLPVSGA